MSIKKRFHFSRHRQLSLFTGGASEFLLDTVRLEAGRLVIAAVVSLLLGVILHPHLAELLIPISTGLYVGGCMAMSKEKKKRSSAIPLVALTLLRGLNIWQRPRPCKYQQRTLRL